MSIADAPESAILNVGDEVHLETSGAAEGIIAAYSLAIK